MPGWREGNSMPTKTAILLTLAAASLGTGTSFAQTVRPGANLPNVADVWILGEGNTSCADASRVVAEERALRPSDAPRNAVAVAKYAMLGMFADGVWTAMNTMSGPIVGETKVSHLVGQDTEFDDRMQMFNSYCLRHPDEDFYSAVRIVRREIVNKQ